MTKINEQELREFMTKMSPETKIYFGCDSERWRNQGKWFADYMMVIVVHIDGCHGCRVFSQVETEQDYDGNASKPFMRMMTEARKVSDLYNAYKDIFDGFECSIHLDINTKKTAGSAVALEAATGYVKGMTNVSPIAKPDAFAASFGADRAFQWHQRRKVL